MLLLALLACAIAYTVAARNIPMDAWTAAETVNTQTLPTVYGIALIVVLSLLLLRASPGTEHPQGLKWRQLAGLCGAIALFSLSLTWVNLWVALAVLLVVCAWWLGERRWLPLAGVSLVLPIVGYLGIERLLGVYVP